MSVHLFQTSADVDSALILIPAPSEPPSCQGAVLQQPDMCRPSRKHQQKRDFPAVGLPRDAAKLGKRLSASYIQYIVLIRV